MSQSIKFAHNYNNKLMCQSFTTIRLRDDARFIVGEYYDLYYCWKDCDNKFIATENYLGKGRLLDIRHFMLNDLNVFMSHLDMGLHQFDGKKELIKLYKEQNVDWSTQQLSYLLIEQDETEIRYIMPDRIKKTNRTTDLFSHLTNQ